MAQKKTKISYHHGALRETLLENALIALKEKGVEKLTLRELARRAGVSHTAPYRHFEDKNALLIAVATHGFESLTQKMLQLYNQKLQINSLLAFQSIGISYLAFAQQEIELFRLMFGSRLSFEKTGGPLQQKADATFQVVIDGVIRCQKDGYVRAGDPRLIAQTVWSQAHGLVNLIVDGQLLFEGDQAKEAFQIQSAILYQGLVDS